MVEDNITPFVPAPGTAHTQVLTQKHLDEAARAIGRLLWEYEVKILDELVSVQSKVNRKLMKQGRANRTHSMDEVIAIFVERVTRKDAQKITDAILSDHGGKKAEVYKQLNRIANSS